MAHNTVAQIALGCALGETRTFTGTHQVSEHDATAVDISGWTITVTIKNAGGTSVTISGSVVTGPSGKYSWTTTPPNTLTLGVGDDAIDIWRTDIGSETLMGLGTFSITQEVRV
jgi:Tfp pilus assembly protein PilV